MADEVLRIEDLVATASLDVSLLAGGDGLRREVLWAHSCEMVQPERWLGPHELLMTVGLCVPHDADEQVAFIATIDDAGLAGLMIGDADHHPAPPLSPAMLAEADARGFPILLAGESVAYAVVARHVAAANWSTHSLQVMRLSKLYHLATYADGGLDALLRDVVDVLRVGLRIEDAEHGFVLASTDPVGRADAPVHERRHRLRGAHAVDLVTVEHDAEQLDSFLLVHLMKLLEVATDSVLNAADRHAEVGAQLMTGLLTGTVPEGVGERLHPHVASDGFRLAAFDLDARHRVARAAALAQAPVLVGAGRTRGLALVPATALPTLRGIRDELDVRMGVSSTFFDAADTRTAAVEAAKVHAAAEHAHEDWSEFEGSTLSVLTRSAREAGEIVAGVLGPLADDGDRPAMLRETLFAYLRNDRRWKDTAAELGIHRQTLSYRLGRIAEETGLDLQRTADLSSLWIAMHAWESLHPAGVR